MKQYYTYLYCDPKDNTPVYTGKGFGKRAYDHFKNNKTRLGKMLRKRLTEGYQIVPIITNHASEEVALAMEIFWIAVYGREDLGRGTLFNLTDDGKGSSGYKHTEADKKKMSESSKNRAPQSPDTIAKISNTMKAYVKTPEHNAKVSKSKTGLKATEKHKESLRKGAVGRKMPPMSEDSKRKKSMAALVREQRKREEKLLNSKQAHKEQI
jgi:hypothetical protein